MKLVIGDKAYRWNGADGVPLIHLIRLQREVGIGQNELRTMYREQDALQAKYAADVEIAKEKGADLPEEPAPDLILLGISVWLARLAAGEKLSFEEACDFNLADLRFEPEPGDPVAQEAPDPTTDGAKPKGSSVKSKRPVEAVA